MSWPFDGWVGDWTLRLTLAFVLALALNRVFHKDLVFRRYLWVTAFGTADLAALPLPNVQLAIPQNPESIPHVSSAVYELSPKFPNLLPTYTSNADIGLPAKLLTIFTLFGASLFAWRWFCTISLVRRSEQVTEEPLLNMLYEVGQTHALFDVPILKRSDEIDSPCLWGITQPVILIPATLEPGYSESDWRLILDHELWHLRQRDPLRFFVYALASNVLWWNPLVWIGFRQAILAQELANDCRFVGSRDAYVRLLTSTKTPRKSPLGLRNLGNQGLLARIRAIAKPDVHRRNPWSLVTLPGFLAIIIPVSLVKEYRPNENEIGFDEVIFDSNATGVNRLWRMATDGRQPSILPNLFVGVSVPTISPDGKWLAYNRMRGGKEDIYIARVNGLGERLIVATEGRDVQPIWSPDGTKLAFCTTATGTWEVAVADLRLDSWRYITRDGRKNLEPAWHPNGERLIFSSHRSGRQKIWTMNLDGSGLVQLTYGDWEDTGARYSRTGQFVAFASDRRRKYDVWLLDLATRKARPLTALSRVDAGEVRFADNDEAVLMSTTENGQKNICRIELSSNELSLIGIPPDSRWPSTR